MAIAGVGAGEVGGALLFRVDRHEWTFSTDYLLHFVVRRLGSSLVSTWSIVLTLGLGIGLAAATGVVVCAVTFDGLPILDADRAAVVDPSRELRGTSVAACDDWQRKTPCAKGAMR